MDSAESIYIYNGEIDEVHNRKKLEYVELPEGLIRIGYEAFYDCINLKGINIPTTVNEIWNHAFYGCEKLEEIILPEGLQRLGSNAFLYCKSLQKIKIPPNIKIIAEGTFESSGLIEVIFSEEGITEIAKDAFTRCKSLVSVTLPSSLKVIGEESFEGCKVLNEIHLPESLESIQRSAFKDCNFTNMRIPTLNNVFDLSILGDNTSLVSLELPESLLEVVDNAWSYASLGCRNITLPPECKVCKDDSMRVKRFIYFGGVFRHEDSEILLHELQQRFDELPIHKICYYQSYHDKETTIQQLKREVNPRASNMPDQLNETGKQQDYLGMTPLHILACSTKPLIEMYRLLIDKYPETLIMKDKWGDIPLLYAIWCNAPSEVIDLLVERYKTLHPDYEFDWKGMIQTLAQRNVPLKNIQRLINTQTSSFPHQEYDMQQVVLELASLDAKRKKLHGPPTPIEMFRYLLRIGISKRLDSLAARSWREELENNISSLSENKRQRDRDTRAVYTKLANYESIKESTSVLELALWKAKIDESLSKRAKVGGGDISYKEQCRVNCGADIIIRNVMPYLA